MSRFLKAFDNVDGTTKYWAWPFNSLGRYVSAFMANYIFLNTTSPELIDAVDESALITPPVGDFQEVTDQGNRTSDFLITNGYAMDQVPVANSPIGVAVISARSRENYNQGTVNIEQVEKMSGQAFATWIKSYLEGHAPTTLAPTFSNFKHYVVKADPASLPNDYVGRIDANNCGINANGGTLSGWFANKNYPTRPVVIRVTRDGVLYGNFTCDRARTDVRDFLATLGVSTSATVFGYAITKSPDDSDGKPHTYRVYGGTSDTEATSDTGALNTITCGTPTAHIVQYVLLGSASIAGGESGNFSVKANFSDDTQQPFIGAGTYSKQGSWPAGPVITPGASATAQVSNPVGTVPVNTSVMLRFTLPGDGTAFCQESVSLLASGLLGVKYEVVVNPGNAALRDIYYYMKSTVDLAAKTYVNGTLVDSDTLISPSISDGAGYTRKSYIQAQPVGTVIKHEFFYADGTVVIFEHTVTLGAASSLTSIYPILP